MSKNLIVKGNALIEARGKLTTYETKIMAWCAAQIQEEDSEFYSYEMSRSVAIRLFGFDDKMTVRKIRELIRKMHSRIIEIHDPDRFGKNGWETLSLLTKSSYNSDQETFTFQFNYELKPYLLQLKNNFTKLDFRHLMSFKSSHSSKIYEICRKELKKNKTAEFYKGIDELKLFLGISNRYKLFKDFRIYVLEKVKMELRAVGMDLSMTPLRENSRNYKLIQFKVSIRESSLSGMHLRLRFYGLSEEKIDSILCQRKIRAVAEKVLEEWGSQLDKGKFKNGDRIKNRAGLFLSLLEQIGF